MRLLEVHIEVRDVARSLAFYTRLIEYEKVTQWDDGSAAAIVLKDGTAFGLWKKGKSGLYQGRGGEHVHFAFQIAPEDYDKYLGKLRGLSLDVTEHTWPNGQRSLYFFDPDGHQGEFMTVDWLAGVS